jgi:hypothetical protein
MHDGEMSGQLDTPDVIAVALDRRGFISLNPESTNNPSTPERVARLRSRAA